MGEGGLNWQFQIMTEEHNTVARYQFVYRLTVAPGNLPRHDAAGFNLIATPWALAGCLGALARELGWKGVARTAGKLMTAKRLFFVVLCDGALAHYGWVTIGFCRHYQVEPEAAIVGPVETVSAFRGRGLATAGLSAVIQAMAVRGVQIMYIDTADTNFAMQRVIERCGFGKPVSTYPRPEAGL